MIKIIQLKPGLYRCQEMCDVCKKLMEYKINRRDGRGYNRCKVCDKLLCYQCRFYEWVDKLETAQWSYFNHLYCLKDALINFKEKASQLN